jgi:hypothetical protein
MAWKSVRKGTNVNEALVLQVKSQGGLEKSPCKYVEQAENNEKSPTLVVGKKPNGKCQSASLGQPGTKKPSNWETVSP